MSLVVAQGAKSGKPWSHILRLLSLWSNRSGFGLIAASMLSFLLLLARWVPDKRKKKQIKQREDRWIRLTSTLHGSTVKFGRPDVERQPSADSISPTPWLGYCPSCKRPMHVELIEKFDRTALERPALQDDVKGNDTGGDRKRYAYVIALWGKSKEYVVGAMVLGHSIKLTGTPHALVCMHTDDVPAEYLALLSNLWDLHRIEHVPHAARRLCFRDQCNRFEHVFTKLRVFSLVEFDKVLMMDIDMLVLQSIDSLFDLPAPAAMKRGTINQVNKKFHGCDLDGSKFFAGSWPDNPDYSWGPGTGINAGVMLLEPSLKTMENMLREIADENHPEHVKGNGPEQDYLSRYFADAPWTNIGVEYNYQLHQMFHSLRPHHVKYADRLQHLDCKTLKVIHYSGEPYAKPWCRLWEPEFGLNRDKDEEYLLQIAQAYRSYRLWVVHDKRTWESGLDDIQYWRLAEDGEVYELVKKEGGNELGRRVDTPKWAADGTVRVLKHSLSTWLDTYLSLQKILDVDLAAALLHETDKDGSPAVSTSCGNGGMASPIAAASTGGGGGRGSGGSVGGSCSSSSTSQKAYMKYTTVDGWMLEVPCVRGSGTSKAKKASVMCSALEGQELLCFYDPWHQAVLQSSDRQHPLKGAFSKLVGVEEVREILMHENFEEALCTLDCWACSLSAGQMILLAIIGLEGDELQKVLEIVGELGICTAGSVEGSDSWKEALGTCRVFLAAGAVQRQEPPWRTLAGIETAYVSVSILDSSES